MNDDIEFAISFLSGYLNEEVYTDKCIHYHKMAIEILRQQLNKFWIPVSEKLPTSDGRFEVTLKGSKGKRHVEMCNFHKSANEGLGQWGGKWDSVNVIAWRERSKPYR